MGDLDSVYTLNEVASLVWSLLDGRTKAEAIVGRVCQEYEIESGAAAVDVDELLADLREARLIRQVV